MIEQIERQIGLNRQVEFFCNRQRAEVAHHHAVGIFNRRKERIEIMQFASVSRARRVDDQFPISRVRVFDRLSELLNRDRFQRLENFSAEINRIRAAFDCRRQLFNRRHSNR